jgi:hypothetical protein
MIGNVIFSRTVRFAAPNRLLAVLLDFPAGRLRDRHLGYQVVGKPSGKSFLTAFSWSPGNLLEYCTSGGHVAE